MTYACNDVKKSIETYDVTTISISDVLEEIPSHFPSIKFNSQITPDTDLQLHKFSGEVNGISLEKLNLYSVATCKPTESFGERRFIGKIMNESFDFTYGVKQENDLIHVNISFNEPKSENLSDISYTYDVKNKWVVSTNPDILKLDDTGLYSLSPAQTMTYFASSAPQSYDIHCLLHIR